MADQAFSFVGVKIIYFIYIIVYQYVYLAYKISILLIFGLLLNLK